MIRSPLSCPFVIFSQYLSSFYLSLFLPFLPTQKTQPHFVNHILLIKGWFKEIVYAPQNIDLYSDTIFPYTYPHNTSDNRRSLHCPSILDCPSTNGRSFQSPLQTARRAPNLILFEAWSNR